MRLGYDLDGVVLKQDLAVLRMIDAAGDEDKELQSEYMTFYCKHRELLLNPLDFMADGDELFFVTGRSLLMEEATKKWQRKYFPNATLIVTRLLMPTRDNSNYGNGALSDWNYEQAKRKAKAIIDNSIDVYFEDNPEVVMHLRVMCPNTKTVQYGGRIG